MNESTRLNELLSDPTRSAIVTLLTESNLSPWQFIEILGTEPTLMSSKLKELRESGLIKSVRDGKYIIYFIDDKLHPLVINLFDLIDKIQDIMRGEG